MIHTASQEEMLKTIGSQKDDILKIAYQQMLQGCLDHPKQWVWYAVWIIKCKDGSHVGDLFFKGGKNGVEQRILGLYTRATLRDR